MKSEVNFTPLVDNNLFQLTIPVSIDRERFNIDYENQFVQQGFKKKENIKRNTSDLLYFNVVNETYKNGFDHYEFEMKDNVQFFLNKCNSDKIEETCLQLQVLEMQIVMKEKSNDEFSKNDTFYFSMLLKQFKPLTLNGVELTPELIISMLSEYSNGYMGCYTTRSFLWMNEKQYDFLHGSFTKNSPFEKRFSSIYNFLGITDHRLIEQEYESEVKKETNNAWKLKCKFQERCDEINKYINFPNGKNIFISYYIKDEKYFNRVKDAIINYETEPNHDLVNNIYQSECHTNVYLTNYAELVESTFYSKWIATGSVYACSPNSFGVIVNETSSIKPQIVFSKYSNISFFALNHRILNIDLQENIKGTSTNNYDTLNKYYSYIEKVIFYEISSEVQAQILYDKLQSHFRNEQITQTINGEIEIQQNRRLNKIFERLTNYGIYLAVLGIVIAVSSYFATFLGEAHDMSEFYEQLSRILADPFIGLLIPSIIIYILTIKYIKRKKNKTKVKVALKYAKMLI